MSAPAYRFHEAAHFRAGFNREAGAARLAELLRRDGELTTEAIITEGLKPKSPLHPQFDIDPDTLLAEAYEHEAQYLRRVFYVYEPETNREVRATVAVYTRETPEEQSFISTFAALSDEEYRDQVLTQALNEFLALRRKWSDLQEFARIFKAIDSTAKKKAA